MTVRQPIHRSQAVLVRALCLVLAAGLAVVVAPPGTASADPDPDTGPGAPPVEEDEVRPPPAILDDGFVDSRDTVHGGFADALLDAGITDGCDSEGPRFCPGDDVTRAQMAAFLVRSLDLPPTDEAPFTDVAGSVHADDINALAASGITMGCTPERFCPNGTVTRAQMAAFIARGFDLRDTEVEYFVDVSGEHREDVNRAAKAAVTSGCALEPRRFCGNEELTRGQMAAFIGRALSLRPLGVEERTFAYEVGVRGQVAGDLGVFAERVRATLADPRGWSLDGRIDFVPAEEDGAMRVWLASPDEVEAAAPGCSRDWSCRVGDDVFINDVRWRESTATWGHRPLEDYQRYVINHEVGHWLGEGHWDCPVLGQAAPVMQQQSIDLEGCEERLWPLPEERAVIESRHLP